MFWQYTWARKSKQNDSFKFIGPCLLTEIQFTCLIVQVKQYGNQRSCRILRGLWKEAYRHYSDRVCLACCVRSASRTKDCTLLVLPAVISWGQSKWNVCAWSYLPWSCQNLSIRNQQIQAQMRARLMPPSWSGQRVVSLPCFTLKHDQKCIRKLHAQHVVSTRTGQERDLPSCG